MGVDEAAEKKGRPMVPSGTGVDSAPPRSVPVEMPVAHAILLVLLGGVDEVVGPLEQSIQRGPRPVDGHCPDADRRGPAAARGVAERDDELVEDQSSRRPSLAIAPS